jgi:hypothetical protein
MRYSKWALLLFGAGALLGLVVVSANLSGLGRIASVAMAAGAALLPVAMIADWWSYRPWRTAKPKPRAKSPKRGVRTKSSPPRKRGSRVK